MFRSADAHRKIVLGGLIIAAGTDEWDPAEIVGSLLLVNEQLAQHPGRREQLRQKGILHLEEREAARTAAHS
ncbi:conjugal transfer protein TraD [uncultured Stenotrophomonas sp.]|uniref:conjugal transfer protein TraD n=1 Tax=uncultured Stenotrophomonas sp. TaxID=165438 RepID=UPI0025EE727D|nr:conjugal transfer protein TraD [uncultured Stenotrophomonas sp.]